MTTNLTKVKSFIAESDTVLLAVSVIIAWLGVIVFPVLYRHYQKVQLVEKLPGPSLQNHPHPWFVEFGAVWSAPKIKYGKESVPHVFYHFMVNYSLKYEKEGLYRLWLFNPYRLPFLARPIIVVYDPELVKEIVGPAAYGKFQKGLATRVAQPVIGKSLISLPDGDEWKHQRKLASPAFGRAVLNNATQVMTYLLEEYVFPRWDEKATRNEDSHVEAWMKTLILDVLGLVAFSYNFEGLKSFREDDEDEDNDNNKNLADAFNVLLKECTTRLRLPQRRYLPKFLQKRFHAALKQLNVTITRIVEKRIEACDQGARLQEDLLSQLVRRDEAGERLPKDDILDNVKLFLFAGHETTASTLSYALWHLASHPEDQKRLQQELDDHYAALYSDKAKNPLYSELRDLQFLDAVVKETLRLNPCGVVYREPICNLSIGKGRHVLPKGSSVYVCPWASHHHPAYWERPDEFVPQRFLNSGYVLDESQDLKRPFFPFSMGPRSCVGQQLATAEVRAALAHILRRYELKPSPDAVAPIPVPTLTVSPHEVKLRFKRRSV